MPYTGIVLAFVGVHAAAFLILLAHWVAAAGMFPKAARNYSTVYDQRPVRATLIGLVTYGLLFVLFLNNARIPNGGLRFLAVAAFACGLLLAFIGSSGLALRIGRNLSPDGDTWKQALRGGVMLSLVFITPVLGSLFLLHVGLASGLGAFLLARSPSPVAPAVPAATGSTSAAPPPPPVPVISAYS